MLQLCNMSKNVSGADNQQGSSFAKAQDKLTLSYERISLYRAKRGNPSETKRRAPLSEQKIRTYLLGALHDGTFSSNKRFRISQKGTEWLKILQKLFAKLGYNSWIYKEGKDRKVYVLETLASFLDFKFDPLRLEKREEKIGYVRGFFDAEGASPEIIKQDSTSN